MPEPTLSTLPVSAARVRGDYTLLTGATGLLGRYLLRDLLRAGEAVAVLVRPTSTESARSRIDRILASAEFDGMDIPTKPVVLAGHIGEPDLGLSKSDRNWVGQHCSRIIHNAASLTFHGTNRSGEPWLTNLTGTQHVVGFCRDQNIRDFHYVSTAYVCGTRQGVIRENELDVGQSFRNDYEACKCAAEIWLRGQRGLDLTTYRPAVIIGDSRTGYTSTYHGVYRFFQFTGLFREMAKKNPDGTWHHPVRLRLHGEERRNLVPVDWVSAAITAMATRPECRGGTYHLTPSRPTTSAEIEAALARFFHYRGVTFVCPDGLPPEKMTDYERNFYEYVQAHEEYLSSEPEFDATATRHALPHLPPPRVDADCLNRLIEFGVHDRWGKGPRPNRV